MKPYRKPRLYVESFHMCEHISSGCRIDRDKGIFANYIDKSNCAFLDGNMALYYSGTSACTTFTELGFEENSQMDDYLDSFNCYNSFSTSSSVFVS